MSKATGSANRIALVTGGGSGIGLAVGRALADAGFQLVLAGRDQARLEGAAGGIANAIALAADVSDHDQVDALFDDIEQRFGRLDLLFNNAGTGAQPASVDAIDPAEWRRVIEVNLTGAFLCTRRAFALMRRQQPQGGRIINNGSISAHVPRPHSAPYAASKHGLAGLTKATALDGRPFRISCGQIDIGNAATDLTAEIARGVMQADGRIAAEPVIDVELVARAVLMMAELPLEAVVPALTIMPVAMPFVGRG